MHIIVVGLSHKTAPVEIRERVAFAPEQLEPSLHAMRALPGIEEALIVSTCNRVELYAVAEDAEQGVADLKRFLAATHNLCPAVLTPHIYGFADGEAMTHGFRVTASLDSMVVGEPQIIGQMKNAYAKASSSGSVSTILNRFMHRSFSVAKRVRSETAIASNAVSISFAAVELARKIFDSLENKTVMLIGAGEMCELAAKHFVNQGVAEVLVTNRTQSRAENLAAEFNGRAVPFDSFEEHLNGVDILLSSTGAPDYILSAQKLKKVSRARRYRPMFLIDIAVPRDIEPTANKLDNVYLYDVDDLQGVVQANMKERQKEAEGAEQIIVDEVAHFQSWMVGLAIKPTIIALRQKVEDIRQGELKKTLTHLNGLGVKERQAVEAMSMALINKILHQPTSVLKEVNDSGESKHYLSAVKALFDLPVDDGSSGSELK